MKVFDAAKAVLSKIQQTKPPTGQVRGLTGALGEFSDPKLSDIVDYYRRDEYVAYAVESYSTRTVGMGFFLTGDEEKSLGFIDTFSKINKLYLALHWKIARDLWLAGNSFVNTVLPKKITSLHSLPLSSFYNVLRDEGGAPESYVQLWGGTRRMLDPEEVLHYSWNSVDETAFGEGLINRLARPGKGYFTEKGNTRRRPPLLQIREKMVDNAHRIISRYVPRHAYTNVPTQGMDTFVANLNTLEPEQEIVTDFPLGIEEAKMDPRTRFEALIDLIDRMCVVGLQSPQVRLITLAGFTFASSQAAMETIEPEVRMMQEYIKEVDESLFSKVLGQHGFEVEAANVELHWGVPDRPDLLVADIISAYGQGLGVIDRDEARDMLKEIGWFIKSPGEGEKNPMQANANHFVRFKRRTYRVSDNLYNFLREQREPPQLIPVSKHQKRRTL